MDTHTPPRKKSKQDRGSVWRNPRDVVTYVVFGCKRKRITHAKPLFSRLSEDLTTYIFLFLSKGDHLCLAGTDKRLHTLGCTPTAWKKHVSLRGQTDTKLQGLPEYVNPRSISMSGFSWEGVTDAGFGSFAKKMKNLKKLAIYFCMRVSPEALCDLFDQSPALECVTLVTCMISNDMLKRMGRVLKHLKSLKISGSYNFTATEIPCLGNLPVLETLEISNSLGVTDRCLSAIAKLRQLKYLLLPRCPFMTGNGLEHLRTLPNLIELNLSGGDWLKDEDFKQIAKLKRLQKLECQFCDEITGAGLAHLRDLPSLRKVDFAMSKKVTAEVLRRIAPLEHLQELCLCYCDKIKSEDLADLTNLPLKCCLSGSCPSDDSLMARFMD